MYVTYDRTYFKIGEFLRCVSKTLVCQFPTKSLNNNRLDLFYNSAKNTGKILSTYGKDR
jgi:hypothetical protein